MGHVNWTDDAAKSRVPRKAGKAEGKESAALCQKLEGKGAGKAS